MYYIISVQSLPILLNYGRLKKYHIFTTKLKSQLMFLKDHNKTAIIFKDDKISYSSLLTRAEYFKSLFKAPANSRIAIFSENRTGWLYAFYSVWKNESIPVPIDFMASTEDVAYIINDCKPEVIFCSDDKLSELNTALNTISHKPTIININKAEADCESYVNSSKDIYIDDKEKTAVIIYTSGTTGNPKGVMLSFNSILINIRAISEEVKILTPEDVVLMLLPVHHVLPLVGTIVAPLYIGETVCISPSMASDDIINSLQANKVSILIGVPRLYNVIHKGIMDKIEKQKLAKKLFALARKLKSRSFSKLVFKAIHKKFGGNLKFLVSAGAALDPTVGNDFVTMGFEVLEGYGMTETAPIITFNRPNEAIIGSVGKIISGSKIEIREGEVVFSGKNIMQGYYNRLKETADIIKNGWLYTGDLGHIDENGYLYITGRKKEIIILSNGKNVNPVGIENKLSGMSEYIQEIGVFMKDDLLHAVVVPDMFAIDRDNIDNIEDTIKWKVIDDYNNSVSPYKKIMKFSISKEELPRTRLGKLQRFKLAELAHDKTNKKDINEKVELDEYELIKSFIENDKKVKINPNDHFEYDLAFDSLDKIGLYVFLETSFGVKLGAEDLAVFPTVLKLSEHISKIKNKMSVEEVNWSDILKEKIHIQLPKSWISSNIIIKLSKYFFYVYFRFKSKGLNNLPDSPCIIAPNHQSFFDGLFVTALMKNKFINRTYFYAKEKHIKQKWLKKFAVRNNVIIMDINRDLKLSIQKMAIALKKKKNIIIFPEGTRTKDGNIGQFKKTFAILSKELNIPIVPVSINGAYNALPSGSKFPKPFKKICVEFHEPIHPKNYNYSDLVELVQQKIKSKIEKKAC